ncbi:helix-turn-helix transcriptional regulator, partial [Streptomyces sp. 2MCAF27]
RLLSLLQARPVWTGEELARRLEVTTRTLRTDIHRLRELGYQVEGVPGTAGGYRLRSGETVPPLLFDGDETVAVLVGLRQLAGKPLGGMDEAAERAIGKILQLLPARLRDQARAVATFIDSDSGRNVVVAAEVIRVLAAACQQRTRTRFQYRSHGGDSTTRDVEPYRVVSVRGRWYLLAWDTDREDWRTFRLDRLDLVLGHSGARFEPRPLPTDDPAAYVLARIQRMPWPYQAELIVERAAQDLVDLPPNAVVEAIDEHTSRVRLSADSPRLLVPWLGLLDADFRLVDAPDRAELAAEIDQVRRRYADALTA